MRKDRDLPWNRGKLWSFTIRGPERCPKAQDHVGDEIDVYYHVLQQSQWTVFNSTAYLCILREAARKKSQLHTHKEEPKLPILKLDLEANARRDRVRNVHQEEDLKEIPVPGEARVRVPNFLWHRRILEHRALLDPVDVVDTAPLLLQDDQRP